MIYRYQSGDRIFEITLERQGETVLAKVAGQTFPVRVLDSQPGQISLMFAGRPVTLYYAAAGGVKWVSLRGCSFRLDRPAPASSRRAGERPEDSVRAPMPAQVLSTLVMEGDQVAQGQTLLILEAMKMEIHIRASRPGKIARLLIKENQPVERDQLLVEIE